MIGGDGERIYIRIGTIFAFVDDPKKKFESVGHTFHVTSEQFNEMVFFDTAEEAKAAGYKKSVLSEIRKILRDLLP